MFFWKTLFIKPNINVLPLVVGEDENALNNFHFHCPSGVPSVVSNLFAVAVSKYFP